MSPVPPTSGEGSRERPVARMSGSMLPLIREREAHLAGNSRFLIERIEKMGPPRRSACCLAEARTCVA